jgi:hypothetical protein
MIDLDLNEVSLANVKKKTKFNVDHFFTGSLENKDIITKMFLERTS